MRRIELLWVVSLIAGACADAAVVGPVSEQAELPDEFTRDGLRFTPLYENRSEGHSGAPVYYFEPGDPSGYVAGITSGGSQGNRIKTCMESNA